jgi:hypothetical protein
MTKTEIIVPHWITGQPFVLWTYCQKYQNNILSTKYRITQNLFNIINICLILFCFILSYNVLSSIYSIFYISNIFLKIFHSIFLSQSYLFINFTHPYTCPYRKREIATVDYSPCATSLYFHNPFCYKKKWPFLLSYFLIRFVYYVVQYHLLYSLFDVSSTCRVVPWGWIRLLSPAVSICPLALLLLLDKCRIEVAKCWLGFARKKLGKICSLNLDDFCIARRFISCRLYLVINFSLPYEVFWILNFEFCSIWCRLYLCAYSSIHL